MTKRFLSSNILLIFVLGGCAAETSEEPSDSTSDELRAGVNGAGCKRSAYNCSLHPGGAGQRVTHANGSTVWPVAKSGGIPVVDGNGAPMGTSKQEAFTLNYGQTRRMNGVTWVMAMSSGLGAAGWIPLDALANANELRARVGEVNAHGAGLAKMACYEVAGSYDPKLDHDKVVRGATDKDSEEPNDYLPQKRANGRVYANLAFSVPGDGLGAPAIDILPAGTKFQRLDVSTWESPSRPSLDVKLYSKPAGSETYTHDAGAMKFVYGYVHTPSGVRYGWMPLDGLHASSGCPDR